ncbi:MAG: hypothetical protein KBG58_06205, partial [Giesbergeria sp.]|nr:hypothetical protein [Giesbergeria sp.]
MLVEHLEKITFARQKFAKQHENSSGGIGGKNGAAPSKTQGLRELGEFNPALQIHRNTKLTLLPVETACKNQPRWLRHQRAT